MRDPGAAIQWQNTEACIDVWCACGEDLHHDGVTIGQVQCPQCDVVWVLETALRKRTSDDFQHDPTVLASDDDDDGQRPAPHA